MTLPRHTTRGPARTGAMAVLITLTAACAAPLTYEEQLTVERYLVCFECPAPLKAVLLLADRKPRASIDSLDVALRRGPTMQRAAETDSLLHAGYTRDSTWRSRNARPALSPRDSVVSRDSSSYVNGYRARGALGLGWIGTTRARRDLDEAIATGQLPPSVLAAARFARDSLPSANGPPRP